MIPPARAAPLHSRWAPILALVQMKAPLIFGGLQTDSVDLCAEQ